MMKIILMLCLLQGMIYADFMDSVGDVVKSALSDDEKEVPEIETVGTVETISASQSNHKEDSVLDSMVDSVKDTIGLKKNKPKKSTSLIGDGMTVMKEVVGLDEPEKDNAYFDDGIMADIADMIELEKGETFGLPSVFGLNKKKKKKVFGSTILGNTILRDAKDTSTTFYRGFKRSGETTEFMSGVMYKSSKMYNDMFEMFDDSPLNVFDDKDKREPSVFDMFDKGNEVLDNFE